MADSNTLGLPSASAITPTDELDIVQDVATTPEDRRVPLSALSEFIHPANGWTSAGAWTYASATTITVASGAALIYSVGDKVRWKQGGAYKYAYIITVANTLLTLAAGADFTVANSAITDNYYSKSASPVGFPVWFALTAPAWTTTGTAFTNQPTGTSYFAINGKTMIVRGQYQCDATSGGTGIFIATFTAGEMPNMPSYSSGVSFCYSSPYSGFSYSTGVTIRMAKYDATALATNSQYFGFLLTTQIA